MWIVWALGLLFGSTLALGAGSPNVLFVVVDDLRPELGCYGDETAVTPNLDTLAARGLRFERAYCQQAVCSPSRTSVLTGLRPDSTQVYDLQKDFRDTVPDVVTLPQHFKNHGWQSEAIGKVYHSQELDDDKSWSVPWTYGQGAYWRHPDNQILIQGLREQGAAKGLQDTQLARASRGPAWEWAEVEDDEYPDGRTAAMASKRLRSFANSGEPFFLAVGFLRPHLPFCAPRKYWDLYDHESLPLATDRTRPEGAPGWALTNWGELRSYHGIPPQGKVDAETERNLVHAYYACTSYIDALIGSLVQTLDETGLASNTVIVLWSDHGWKLGEYSCWSKHTNVELDTRVPMLIVAPGDHPRAAATDALVELVDLYPTLCELADLPVPDHVEGTSLAPLVEDPATPWASAAFSQYPRNTKINGKTVRMMGDSMRTDRYRFTRWRHRNDPDQVVAYELYDHEVDPMEMHNLADDPNQAELVKQLDAQVLAGWRAAKPIPGQQAIKIGKPRITMPDLIRSWSWVDQSLAAKPMDLEQRRAMSKRLDAITMLFFQNDIGAVANAMDDISLELVVNDSVSDAHRAAAALLVRLDDGEPGTSLSSRWRYHPPELMEPVKMRLLVTSVNEQAHEIDVLLSPGQDVWSLEVDEEALEALPSQGTMHLSLVLDDGTHIPQGRWERTSVPFSRTRAENLAQLESVESSAARDTFESRNARLRDEIRKMDITGHVLDRNQLRGELAEELEALKRGEDPYINRAGDTWYMVPVGSTEMPVRVYAPPNAIASQESLPLLIALHGAGGNEHFFMDGCGDGAISELADQHEMIVVSPSTYVMGSSMEPLGILIDTMSERYAIDQDRIYLLGHSLGGMTAMGLLAGRPELIDGVVAIAGGAPFPKDKSMPPVLAYAAERDFIVPADMIESSARAAQEAGAPVTPRRPDGTGHLTIVIDVLPESIEWLMALPPRGTDDGS